MALKMCFVAAVIDLAFAQLVGFAGDGHQRVEKIHAHRVEGLLEFRCGDAFLLDLFQLFLDGFLDERRCRSPAGA